MTSGWIVKGLRGPLASLWMQFRCMNDPSVASGHWDVNTAKMLSLKLIAMRESVEGRVFWTHLWMLYTEKEKRLVCSILDSKPPRQCVIMVAKQGCHIPTTSTMTFISLHILIHVVSFENMLATLFRLRVIQ